MYEGLQAAYREAAAGNALIADVGTAFYQKNAEQNLYAEDGSHPNEAGSRLAAKVMADVIAIMEHNLRNGGSRLASLQP